MPDVVSSLPSSWRDAAEIVSATMSSSWRDAALITSTGSAFVKPEPPSGSTPTAPSLDALYVLPAAAGYNVVHTLSVVDLTDGAEMELSDLTIQDEDGSMSRTLTANGPRSLFERVNVLGPPPVFEFTIDGIVLRFMMEDVGDTQGEFGFGTVAITGRSITMLAGEPYQMPQYWVNDGPSTAAQIVEQAQLYTGLEVQWQLTDWPVPDKLWSYFGSPLSVAQRVAESVGATVQSDPAELRITIAARYRELPNVWHLAVPDLEIHLDAVMLSRYQRADRPSYNGVYVSGLQQGAVALVRLEGTAGDILAPPATDLLLTDIDAVQQRGMSILGAGGPQARVELTLPILVGPGLPGIVRRGWLCRVVQPGATTWWGIVRSVSVAISMPSAVQTVRIERHTALIAGTIIT